MAFISLTFAIFLCVMLVGYYCIPKKTQWLWLLLGSYVFYMWASPLFALFLLFSTITTYIVPCLMGRADSRLRERLALKEVTPPEF